VQVSHNCEAKLTSQAWNLQQLCWNELSLSRPVLHCCVSSCSRLQARQVYMLQQALAVRTPWTAKLCLGQGRMKTVYHMQACLQTGLQHPCQSGMLC
jgi:hypothetical protein